MITPEYYGEFKCLAGSCTHNCCRNNWLIEIDEESLNYFRGMEGNLGNEIKLALDGNTFGRINGQCPLLDKDGLCVLAKNGVRLCTVCDEYPRFFQNYESYIEGGISVSCEEAARIVMEYDAPFKLRDTGKTAEMPDDPVFGYIYNARKAIIDILQDRRTDIWKRLRLALDYGAKLEERMLDNSFEPFEYIPKDKHNAYAPLSDYIAILCELDIMDKKWSEMLTKARDAETKEPNHTPDSLKCERLAVYFIYRYFLRAVYDNNIMTKLKFAALSTLLICALANIYGDYTECARMFSLEVEHDEDNVEEIFEAFIFEDNLQTKNVIDMII